MWEDLIAKLILRLENVGKSYPRSGASVEALSDVSLDLARGDFVGILGPGGAGKTTLLRVAAGLEVPDRGSVSYQGRSLVEMSKAEMSLYRRHEVGCAWGTRLLNPGLSVLDNVALPLLFDGADHGGAERDAHELLVAVRADHCADAMPEELSDGEQQRVAIAQALVAKPRLLLADEPVSNLDPIEQDSLLALFQSVARDAQMAVLITGADAAALMRARPILYLRKGRLVSAKPPERLGQVVELPVNSREESA